jgi:hypothetical protein
LKGWSVEENILAQMKADAHRCTQIIEIDC